MWRNFEIIIHSCSPSSLTGIERICKEDQTKQNLLSRYAKLVGTYKRLAAVIAAFLQTINLGCVNTNVRHFGTINHFLPTSK